MLLRPAIFSKMCEAFESKLSNVVDLSLSIQTNGTVYCDAWAAALQRHNVSVGVSIDGMREDNDRYRLDHRGRSTFDSVVETINRLVESAFQNKSELPSSISVLDPDVNYYSAYRFLRDLGIEQLQFLLPDRNGDDTQFRESNDAGKVGQRLLEIFYAWLEEDNPDIRIRFIDETLRHFQVGFEPGPVRRRRKDVQVLIVGSDGSVSVDDSYIPALDWYENAPTYSIFDSTVRQVLSDPIYSYIEEQNSRIPDACQKCRWRNACRGGDLENRFRSESGFNNPSIYCESYKVFYSGVCDLLTKNGYPNKEIQKKFGT